jgi:uncharacterized protein YndB with AHSA1/START domain
VLRRHAVYARAIDDVWAALTDGHALAEWLMPTTFAAAETGHRFRFQYDPDFFCPAGIVECEVLEVEPPVLMVWSWRHAARPGMKPAPAMRVEWHLAPVEGGTRVELAQTGLEGQPWLIPFAMGVGWRFYLRRFLPRALANVAEGRFTPGAIPIGERAYRATNLPPEVII